MHGKVIRLNPFRMLISALLVFRLIPFSLLHNFPWEYGSTSIPSSRDTDLFKSFIHHSGEANVYTLGDVGAHRVVTTKLPMASGSSGGSFKQDALIATGSTTTRLLGTFQVGI